MNKKLLILPVISALLLAGCTLGRTTKKRKKSSSVESSQSVTPGPGGTSVVPGGSSQQPGGSSQQPGGTSQQPGGSSSTPTPAGDWSSTEKTNFQTVFHGIVPPYLSVGLNATATDLENGYFESNVITEAAITTYFASFDNTWEDDVDEWEDPLKRKSSADGKGYVECYINYNDNYDYVISFEWISPVVSISASGYPATFEVGDTFSHEGIAITVAFKDGASTVIDTETYIEKYFTFSTPDMTSAGQKTVTVTYKGDTSITTTYTITVNSSVKYTVSFDAGEGSGTKAAVEASEGSYILPDATGFTAPEGKAFAGWKANNTGDLIPAGGTYNLTAAVTFYAQWASEYTVSFAAGEGSGTMAPVKVGEGGKINEPTCTFTAPTGKEFDKWVIGTQAVTFPYTVTANVTFTATWKDAAPVATEITISKDDIASFIPSGNYPSAAFEFTTDGVSFSANEGIGVKTSESSGGNYFFEQNAMQWCKQGHQSRVAGLITVKEAVEASLITVHWMATYDSEAKTYHPVVKVGTSADNISTEIACNEGTTVSGVATGKKNGNFDAYDYTTTYTIPAGNTYFSIGAGTGAQYVKDVVITLK